ncbi:MAG: TonB-dependent receptor plug domain-containing protein, partial [Alphaproteobacteria bacterium]
MKRILALALLAASGMASVAMAQEGETTALEDLIVVAPSPLGGGVSLSRLGETISSVGSEELAKTGSLSIGDALQQNISGVNVSDTQGNAFTGDVNYRGFTASALQGLPQGLAVYLNGQRLNEAFGDTMNWDLIPQVAIAQIDLVTSNPAFGLNAIGGALSLRTRDGFGFHGLDASAQTGAFGTQIGTLQGGWSNNTTSLYAAVDGGKIDGWRPNGGSSVARAFGDLGYKTAKSEVHVVAGVSDTRLGVVGPTPVDLLEDDRKAIFTFPQTSHNNARFAAANGKLTLDDHWSLQGGVHTRRFQQTHLDGNDGDFERCAATGPMANTLCLVRDGFPTSIPDAEFQLLTPVGAPIACPVSNVDADGCRNQISSLDGPRVPYGTLDRTATNTTTAGASLQLSNNAKLGERKNSLNVGGAYDSSDIRFNSHSTLA